MKLSEELGKWRIDRPDEWKMDEFRRRAKELEAERDVLAAQVENLVYISKELSGCIAEYEILPEKSVKQAMFNMNKRLQTRIATTPQQCLAEIRAEAARAGFIAGVNWVFDTPSTEITTGNANEAANQYAHDIRQGGDV
jgi:hypothetical protein